MWKVGVVLLAMSVDVGTAQSGVPESAWQEPKVAAMASAGDPQLDGLLRKHFKNDELLHGQAVLTQGAAVFFVMESGKQPSLVVDDKAPVAMTQIPGGQNGAKLWFSVQQVTPVGTQHSYHYVVNGVSRGGSTDLPVFAEDSYLRPGVKEGTLSEKKQALTSKVYEGMVSEFWTYAPAGLDATKPAPLMVFQDGGGYVNRDASRVLNVIDNLTAQGKIPAMVYVFTSPGKIDDAPGSATYKFVKKDAERLHGTMAKSMRSVEYDTVSDRYVRFLREDLLPVVERAYKLRKDAYSRAISGSSSGGICAFNAAWQAPEEYGRVLSWVGSFTSIQWEREASSPEGGQDFPDLVLREPKRNIRVWTQDGANDMENVNFGSWPLANLRLANALKTKGYDFHFSFGEGSHNPAQGRAEFPASIVWLWRDYDPAKTSQIFEQDAAEKAAPFYKVGITSRAAR